MKEKGRLQRSNRDRQRIGSAIRKSRRAGFWGRFRRNRLAVAGAVILFILLGASIFADFVAPNGETSRDITRKYAPPQRIHLFDSNGHFRGPFVYDLKWEVDPFTGKRSYTENKDIIHPIRLFVPTAEYRLWGIIPLRVKLFGAVGGVWYPFGGDHEGRCVFSRCIYATRLSLALALLGAFTTVLFGVILGTLSGYYGGVVDAVIQRLAEMMLSIPRIPLWMAFAAAIPAGWSPVKEFLAISLVLSVLGWGGLARSIRGIVLSLQASDFVLAAKAYGASAWRCMFRHILPNIVGYVVINATIIVPLMILGETSLSFLGLGLRPPANSLGVLLKGAQSVQVLEDYPWLLIPAGYVVFTVLAFNFVGDGIRDALDPRHY